MTNILWTCAGHQICLKHEYWSGAATLKVDGETVYTKPRTAVENSFTHRFQIDETQAEVRVTCTGLAFQRELFLGTECIAGRMWSSSPTFVECLVLLAIISVVISWFQPGVSSDRFSSRLRLVNSPQKKKLIREIMSRGVIQPLNSESGKPGELPLVIFGIGSGDLTNRELATNIDSIARDLQSAKNGGLRVGLTLKDSRISDLAMAEIARLDMLSTIELPFVISELGISKLKSLPGLERLNGESLSDRNIAGIWHELLEQEAVRQREWKRHTASSIAGDREPETNLLLRPPEEVTLDNWNLEDFWQKHREREAKWQRIPIPRESTP